MCIELSSPITCTFIITTYPPTILPVFYPELIWISFRVNLFGHDISGQKRSVCTEIVLWAIQWWPTMFTVAKV